MKIWPQKKWKQVSLVFFVFFLAAIMVTAIVGMYVNSAMNKDVVSGIEVINSGGNKAAFVVYKAGLTSFPRDMSYAFANGLAESGWRVEVITASSQAPSDLSNYSLLVLGFPIYGGSPGPAIVRYVERAGDLHGINTVIIALGAGSPERSVDTMTQKVWAANSTVLKSMTLFSMAPNEGNGSPADIAQQAGTQIRP